MRRHAMAAAIAVAAIVVIAGSLFLNSRPPRLDTSPVRITDAISLRNFSLCPSNCVYPSPYLSGEILVNTSVPLSSLHLLINGTDEGYNHFNNNMSHYIHQYNGGFQNPTVGSGKTYWIEFMATFKDNSTASASTLVVAEPAPEG